VQEELGLTMYAPALCGGRRRVRLLGLPRGGVIDESPFAAVVVVADDKVKGSRANWESSMRAGPTTLGAVLDAGGHSGPRWTGDAWLARRRRYSTARRDRAIA
jgi:hypothetical protein